MDPVNFVILPDSVRGPGSVANGAGEFGLREFALRGEMV